MGWKETLCITSEELVRRASWRLGMMPLDEGITLRRLSSEGIKAVKEGHWYRLTLSQGRNKRQVGGRILEDPLDVLLRCYLLLWEERTGAKEQEAA